MTSLANGGIQSSGMKPQKMLESSRRPWGDFVCIFFGARLDPNGQRLGLCEP